MQLPLYQVDAFVTEAPFSGNPAAVCPLEEWLADATLQGIAAENNLSETAFLVREGDSWRVRWFTPTVEVDLCGHATLASAFVVHHFLDRGATRVRFESRSGALAVDVEPPTAREGAQDERLVLDFPTRAGAPRDCPDALVRALGVTPVEVLAGPYTMTVLGSEAELRALDPDLSLLVQVTDALIATAPAAQGGAGEAVDFVSRFFAPGLGVPEDPVTGSAHCTLTPYWAARLGRARLRARQLSARGGELWCEDRGARTRIAGRATLFLEGRIRLAAP